MTRLFDLPHAATTDDWYTPPWIFEGMAETFDLDVCTSPGGVPWIPCLRYYTPADDGLVQEWTGFVWCNPPYSSVHGWSGRWAEHQNGVIALRADLSSGGQSVAFAVATSVFVPIPRLEFVNGHRITNRRTHRVTFTTLLLGAGPRADVALSRLADRGIVRKLLRNP